jgi:hypothetical protein
MVVGDFVTTDHESIIGFVKNGVTVILEGEIWLHEILSSS